MQVGCAICKTPKRYIKSHMKREELARTLARQHRLTRAEARDQVDQLVHRILTSLRQGKPVELPGVGRLVAKLAPKNDV